MFPFLKKKPLKLQNTIILVVCFSTFVSLIVSAILIRNFILSMNRSSVSDRISSIAKIVASDKLIQKKLQTGDPTHVIQGITNEIMVASNLDFIVVMDPEGIRYSHADPSYIGLPFSSHEDVKKVIGGQEFFSEKEGMLGFGFRYFVPIYYDQEIIGAVCVGLTNNTIDNQVKDGQKMIAFSLIIGLSVGIIGAVFLAQKMKKVLLGLEPQEIAEQLSEKTIIENEVDEGILAISSDKTILLINTPAKNIFYQTKRLSDFEVGKKISDNLYDVLFKETIEHQTTVRTQFMYLNGIETISSVTPLFSNDRFLGAVATLRNRSEVMKLMEELGGTKQYINSMRAQTHEFMNKLHVISGLIDLKKYEEVTHFIQQLNQNYKKEIGQVSNLIKVPAIAGFLLGKINEAKEQSVEMLLESDSFIPKMEMDDSIHSLLQVLGNLLDNAKEAVLQMPERNGQVRLHLNYDTEAEVFIVTVCDDGVGISEEISEKIFTLGFSTKGINRGYGLNIIHSIVKRHGGILEFSKQANGGTIVYLELPKKEDQNDDKCPNN